MILSSRRIGANGVPVESVEQQELVKFLRLKKLKFTSVPNSTYTKSIWQKMFNKAMGLNAGLPDLLIILPGKEKDKLLFIEMKRRKGGVLLQTQKEWIAALNRCAEVEAIVCRGSDEAIAVINERLAK